MKKILLALFSITVFSSYVAAQDYPINWSAEGDSKGTIQQILPISSSEFVTVRILANQNYLLEHYENFKLKAEGKILEKLNGSNYKVEGVKMVNGKIYAFLSSNKKDKESFYSQEYDINLTPKGNPKEFSSFICSGCKGSPTIEILFSENKNFLVFDASWYDKSSEKATHSYVVFSNEMQALSQGKYEIPFSLKHPSINKAFLSNAGKYIRVCSEYEAPEKNDLESDPKDYKDSYIFILGENGYNQIKIETEGNRLMTTAINSSNADEIYLIGTYGDLKESQMHGLYKMKFNLAKETQLTSRFEEIPEDITLSPSHFYTLRNTYTDANENTIGVLEEFGISKNVVSGTATYTLNFENLIVFKLEKNGELGWVKTLEKHQGSMGQEYLGISVFLEKNNLVVLFNDNPSNYNEQGLFAPQKDKKDPKVNLVEKSNSIENIVAMASFDMTTGQSKRKVYIDKTEYVANLVPQVTLQSPMEDYVILYTRIGKPKAVGVYVNIDNKERFGVISLE